MELAELERLGIMQAPPPAADEPESEDFDEQMLSDIHEAIELFATVKTLLDFVGHPVLCKTLTKRERDTISKVSEQVRGFLASIEPTYNEEDE